MSFESFDECKLICFGICCPNLKEPNWKLSNCTCSHFFKNYTCEHIIGLSARFDFLKIPIEAKTWLPTKTKRALELQDGEIIIDDESSEDEVDIIQEPLTKRIA